MNKFSLVIVFIICIFTNFYFVKCLKNSNDTIISINTENDKQAYNPNQNVIIDINVQNGQEKKFNLTLACKDEIKCIKIFNCSSNCGQIKIENGEAKPNRLNLIALSSGHVILFLKKATNETDVYPDLSKSFVRISIGKSEILEIFSLICGWIYFTSWSVSFYPQIWLNIKRKSVVGLNFDFIVLNVTGFFFYSIYNTAMRFIPSVQNEYFDKNPFSLIPVEINDVVFAIHALIVSLITLIQCFFIYERQNQAISKPSIGLLIILWLIAIFSTILLAFKSLNVLIYLNLLSYIKLFISFIKYIPQAYYNYQRKSTVGWSIGNILFDLTGGSFSLLQICLINFNYDDWGNIKGNLTKFGLGLLSMSFDFLFIIQHYVLYKNSEGLEKVQKSSSNSDSGCE